MGKRLDCVAGCRPAVDGAGRDSTRRRSNGVPLAAITAILAGLVAAACTPIGAPPAPEPYRVTQTILSPGGGPNTPALEVSALSAPPLTRNDWAIAEAAARDHCAGQGTELDILPATTAYTQVQYDDGIWTFVARCAPV